MARVIFPSGGAFKPARSQYVQAYREPARQKSSFLTDATRAVDLVGKIVDNPLVSYITNEIYNASRDMDPEEVAQGAMKKREQAQMADAQRFDRGWDAAGIRGEDNAEEIARQRQLAANAAYVPGPVRQLPGRDEQGERIPSKTLLRERRLEEAALGSKAALESYGRTPSAPEEVIQERVEVTEEVQTVPQPAEGSITPGKPRVASAEENLIGFLSNSMPEGVTGPERLKVARRIISDAAKIIADKDGGSAKNANDMLRMLYSGYLAKALTNLRATGNISGRLDKADVLEAASAFYDTMSATRSKPVTLPPMRELRSIPDILRFVMMNPNLSQDQIKALQERGGEVARSKKGLRGLAAGSIREDGEMVVLDAIAKIMKGHKEVDPIKRLDAIRKLAQFLTMADDKIVSQITAIGKLKFRKDGGTGSGKGKRRKGGGELWEVAVMVDGKRTYVGVREAHRRGLIADMPDPYAPAWATWARSRIAQGKVRSTAKRAKDQRKDVKALQSQATAQGRTVMSKAKFVQATRTSTVRENQTLDKIDRDRLTKSEKAMIAALKNEKADAEKALGVVVEANAALGVIDDKEDTGALQRSFNRTKAALQSYLNRLAANKPKAAAAPAAPAAPPPAPAPVVAPQ